MKGTDVFPGKSLKAADLGDMQPVVTIKSIGVQTFDDNTSKPVIFFEGKEKSLVCNKTNWNAIVEITGEDDSDHWPGHRIKLVVAKVDFQGKRVPAIRVEAPNGRGVQTRPAPRPAPVQEVSHDDDCPF